MEAEEAAALRAEVRQLACHVAHLRTAFAVQQEALLESHRRLDSLDRELYQWQKHIRQLCRSFRREYILSGRVADRVGNLEERERVAEALFADLEARVIRFDETQQALSQHIDQLRQAILEVTS